VLSKGGFFLFSLTVFACGVLLFAGSARAVMIQQWTASYNGPADDWDAAYDVATDANGNVYVTGYSNDGTSVPDVFVAKYDPHGVELWTQRWDGLTHESDAAVSIAVDRDGNAYLAGSTASGGQADALLLKYNTDGDFQWQVIYDGGHGDDAFIRVAVDGAGFVYVAGSAKSASAGLDYVVAKYNGDGVEQWLSLNNGPANGDDWATGLALDSDGSVYINGQQTTGAGMDVALVKYSSTGAFQWKTFLNGALAGSIDYGGSVVVNGADRIFYSGMLDNAGTGYDIATAFVDKNNTVSWLQTIDGSAHINDYLPEYLVIPLWVAPGVRDLAIGAIDSVYAIGIVNDTTTNKDIVTAKYSLGGALQWWMTFNLAGTYDDLAVSLAVDQNETAFVAGFGTTDGAFNKYVTLMYDSGGGLLDSQTFAAPGGQENKAQNITVDPDGNPIVTGYGWQGAAEEYNAYTVKYCVGCLISSVCYPNGVTSVDNPCLICDVFTSQTGWSNNDGAACDDGLFCNGADACAAGTCSAHAGDPCNADETCDEASDVCVPQSDDDATPDDDTTSDDDLIADDDTIDDDAAGDDNGGSGGCGC
jgi:uncharacterized delta-60 repeat protein